MTDFLKRCCFTARDVMRRMFLSPTPPANQARSDDRDALFQRLDQLRSARDHAIAQHNFEKADLAQQLGLLENQAQILRQLVAEKEHEQFCASLNFSVEEDLLLAGLQAKTSMSLQLFLEEIDGELETLRRKEPFSSTEMIRDYTLMKKRLVIHTDGPSISRRTRALIVARQRAREMIYEPMTVEEMNKELLRLRHSIPEVVNEEIRGERAAIVCA